VLVSSPIPIHNSGSDGVENSSVNCPIDKQHSVPMRNNPRLSINSIALLLKPPKVSHAKAEN